MRRRARDDLARGGRRRQPVARLVHAASQAGGNARAGIPDEPRLERRHRALGCSRESNIINVDRPAAVKLGQTDGADGATLDSWAIGYSPLAGRGRLDGRPCSIPPAGGERASLQRASPLYGMP